MQSDQSYKEGQTYTYALEGTSVSSVSEGQGEATLRLKADVELAVKPDCIRQLRLKNVQVNGAVSKRNTRKNTKKKLIPWFCSRTISKLHIYAHFRPYRNKMLKSTRFSLTITMGTLTQNYVLSLETPKPLLISKEQLSLSSNPP